jgi:toxin ParE1/3/4
VKDFQVEEVAQAEFEEATGWYEDQRDGLGLEFVAEVRQVLLRIANQATFPTAAIAVVEGGLVRREFVDRFPYIVVFVESAELRRVIMIRRASSDIARWRSRI